MENLRAVLRHHLPKAGAFGSDDVGLDLDVEGLRADLLKLARLRARYWRVCLILVLILFVGALVLVFWLLGNPAQMQAIFGATGLSIGGLITLMMRLLKERWAADVALALLSNLRSDVSVTALEVIMSKL